MSVSGMHQEAVVVKEEPGWSLPAGSCGVSEAAARAGLYTDHEVKDELVVGPECLQPRDVPYTLAACVKNESELVNVTDHLQEETECMTDETEGIKKGPSNSENIAACGVSAAAARAGLYTGHAVKDELVLGPECLQRPDVANLLYGSTSVRVGLASSPTPLSSAGQQHMVRECVVRLERMDMEMCLRTDMRRSMEQDNRHGVTVESLDHPSSSIVCKLSLGRGGQQPSPRDCEVRLHHDTCRGMGQRPPALTTRADNHSIVEGIHERGTYLCDICKKRFALKSRLMKHMIVHMRTSPSVERKSGRGRPDGVSGVGARSSPRPAPSPSTHTARTHTTPAHNTTKGTALSGHTPAHRKKGHSCRVCGKEFKRREHLKTHERIHSGEKPFSCGVCEKKFTQYCNLKTHESTHMEDKPYICGVCKKRFRIAYSLKAHILLHTGESPYFCEICTKRFTRPFHLKRHIILIHSGKKPHSCGVCDERFSHLPGLKKHMLIHTGKKLHSCEVCNEGFPRLSALKYHKLIHTGERPYPCKICTIRFRRIDNLKKHILIHTGEKPHACGECKKRFSTRSGLKDHERIHTGEKLHSCKICSKRYTRLRDLNTHALIHTEKDPLLCAVCQKEFIYLGRLKRHEIRCKGKPRFCEICKKKFSDLSSLIRHARTHAGHKPYSCDVCARGFNVRAHLVRHIRGHAAKERSANTKRRVRQ